MKNIQIFSAVFALLAVAAVASAENLQKPGKDACTPEATKKLSSQVRKLARKDNPQDAVQTALAILCGSGTTPVVDRMADKVTVTDFQTGDEKPTIRFLYRNAALAAPKGAMDADAVRDFEEIQISYHLNEACVSSFKLGFDGAKWLLVSKEDACD